MTLTATFRSGLGPAISEYLSLKRALGRKYEGESYVLARLDRFLAAHDPSCTALTPAVFTAWCMDFARLSPNTRRGRMRIARNLCLNMQRTDPACFVPDITAFPTPQPHRRPHIFTEDQIVRLLQSAALLQPRSTSPLLSETYRLAVVVLYTAGLRRGELVRLNIPDYDPVERTLLIRASKFHRSRLVALSSDATREMEMYLVARRRLGDADGPLLIRSCRGLRARSGAGFGASMRRLFRSAGVRTADGRCPRVHDIRHTHAVHALLRWYRAGADVQAKLPALAASMGHVSVVSTAYYLALLDPVAQAASERFAVHAAPILEHLPVARGGR